MYFSQKIRYSGNFFLWWYSLVLGWDFNPMRYVGHIISSLLTSIGWYNFMFDIIRYTLMVSSKHEAKNQVSY